MHEQSLVKALLNEARGLCDEHDRPASSVCEIQVEMGPLSGVEPLLLESAFELLIQDTEFCDTTLVIELVPLLAKCDACNLQFEVVEFVFRCRKCEGSVVVVKGDQFYLTGLTFRQSENSMALQPQQQETS